jgi:hypothetical protein
MARGRREVEVVCRKITILIPLEENTMATATITSDKNAVVAEILIAAPPARVFQAISDPAQPATSEAKRKGWKCLPEWHQSALTLP